MNIIEDPCKTLLPFYFFKLPFLSINLKKIYLAHSFERVTPGQDYLKSCRNSHRVYAGINKISENKCKNFLSNYNNLLGNSKFRGDILSNKEGYVTKIKTRKLGLILIEMGGGRKKITDKIDYSVGFINVTSLNDEIQSGKPLLSVYTKNENDFKKIENIWLVKKTLPYCLRKY